MCTVTFVPLNKGICLTSSRDEHVNRPRAFHPKVYGWGESSMLYPKDGSAGGSWIAATQYGTLGVLLNGAFANHQKNGSYRKSRGWIFLDLMETKKPFTSFLDARFNNIEPFTMIIWQENELYECRWDGQRKFGFALRNDIAQIWSSATLYDESMMSIRHGWFQDHLKDLKDLTQENILDFHFKGGDDHKNNAIKMERTELRTMSITSILCTHETAIMSYYDLMEENKTTESILFSPAEVN